MDIGLIGIFVLSVVIQLIYFQGIYRSLLNSASKAMTSSSSFPPISVIICARNGDKNLKEYLPLVLEQDYPDYEVMVVDDGSSDQTSLVLQQYSARYNHLRVLQMPGGQGKKAALSEGIHQAQYELLVFTDADCMPSSTSWLKIMASNFTPGKDIVLGYGPLKKDSGILNAIIRFDILQIAIQYLSFAIIGKPYMGVGRNLAYRKSLWIQNEGFDSHMDLLSGDDDLFINKVASSNNTAIEIHPDSWTFSDAPSSAFDLFQQKRRHLTTGYRYPFKILFLLGLFPLSTIVFYVTGIILILTGTALNAIMMVAGFRFLIQFLLLNNCCNKLGSKDLLLFSPLLEVFCIILNFSASLTNQFYPKSQWH